MHNTDNTNRKLRIKLPSGAEFEASGDAAFIEEEKQAFLKLALPSTDADKAAAPAGPHQQLSQWNTALYIKEDLVILKHKPAELSLQDAALILIAAFQTVKGTPAVNATKLITALKKSGFTPGRADRLTLPMVKSGLLQAAGTKRNRTYQTTKTGHARAFRLTLDYFTPEN